MYERKSQSSLANMLNMLALYSVFENMFDIAAAAAAAKTLLKLFIERFTLCTLHIASINEHTCMLQQQQQKQ